MTEAATTIRCPKCTESNPIGTKYCRRCGSRIESGGFPLIKIVFGLLAAGVAAIVVARMTSSRSNRPAPPTPPAAVSTSTQAPAPSARTDQKIRIGVAYGTEKQDWLEWAVAEFAKTDDGRAIRVDLKPMGSLEAAQAIVKGDTSIQVWSPASALYKDVFVRDWKAAHTDTNPIASEAPLALTPMVFVMWDQRLAAFQKKYPRLDFRSIGQALAEKGGWDAIAQKPDWMFFKFSHTNPNQSNSGLVALLLMGYDFHGKHSGLSAKNITDVAFQDWLQATERSLVGAASGLSNSTGNLMTAMIQRGWSTYDVILVYENVAIDRLQQAGGRWGPMRVVYPPYNMWNDNPCYVLDVPWSNSDQRAAAESFRRFLLSETVQREAMTHGFRPANTRVATNAPDSPFVRFTDAGIHADVPGMFCDAPNADVIENLLLVWQRSQGSK